jgi:hypothetical protein
MNHLQNEAQLHPEHTVRLFSLQTKHSRAVDTTTADRPSGLLTMTIFSPCSSDFRGPAGSGDEERSLCVTRKIDVINDNNNNNNSTQYLNKIPNNNLINTMITAAEGSLGTEERSRFCVSRKLISDA